MARFRVLLDTNILLRGLIRSSSASGRVLTFCEQRIAIPVLSSAVLREYRSILTDERIVARYPELTSKKVELYLVRLRYVGDMIRRRGVKFTYPRDPKDEELIELAIAGHATHLVTYDDDLLDLPRGQDEAARRFRQRLPLLQVVNAEAFVRVLEHSG